MKTTRFFLCMRRLNSVLISLAALLFLGVLGVFVIPFMDFGDAQAVHVDAESEEYPSTAILGTFYKTDGTPFLCAALTFENGYSGGCVKEGARSIRNYLFFNPETTEARWLFSGDKQIVVDLSELYEIVQKDESRSPERRAIAFSYQTIDTDTNGDKLLTRDDKMTLAYSRPDGSHYTSLIKGIDRILGADTIERGTKHVVAYEADGKWLTVVVSLRTFDIEKKGVLPSW